MDLIAVEQVKHENAELQYEMDDEEILPLDLR